ncbi:MAG: magnesium chelatase domain-containing protein [Acidimicrobiia bacterium]|nr:magnesium chelatase domain-containing protein [Acidimicrobiia bacterium]
MLATVPSATLLGVDGHPVSVEVHVSGGLPGFAVVGLPDAACREARDRVRAALLSSGEDWPQRRVTVNLAPSGRRKGGSGLDVAIAVGLLCALDDADLDPAVLADTSFLGELGLDGTIRPVPGALPLVDALPEGRVVVPAASAAEARLVGRHDVRPVAALADSSPRSRGRQPGPNHPRWPVRAPADRPRPRPTCGASRSPGRRSRVAAAGGHHVLLVGPPVPASPCSPGGSRVCCPHRTASGLSRPPACTPRRARTCPRADSSTSRPSGRRTAPPRWSRWSAGGRVGSGQARSAWPTAVCCSSTRWASSRRRRSTRCASPSRGAVRCRGAQATVHFPARFLLVGAMNPCPCGGGGGPGLCECSDVARQRYARRLSGPLLDRFDLRVNVVRPAGADVFRLPPGEGSAPVAERVAGAREAGPGHAGSRPTWCWAPRRSTSARAAHRRRRRGPRGRDGRGSSGHGRARSGHAGWL